ncbi:class I SAM-dependent methyltransferase [Gloeobacter kilaueensis]|uniref:2-polyprenyl-3-methyl-5-hydroxy-6-metoxy-1, 4-benzoquinol methylase n=1 Tax=Gloeobacter kilaueensis (strain ATCC BAA-2537 / CCAP 1431/1 / ULC 316 / JS1) TaxID=1183438 RepID=U5QS71_GLOK1|nr:class I SAM-dependent methyltransferase [Gloeobacter kilaueensis]AGY60474.1 2-polyprenyl-3-methyl-5-hydroxy-6-metoxy-1,4-benzoquinol methylase [Gloeobacter kilaueensis JS1]
MTKNVCRICGSEDCAATFAAKEMMYGMREEFDYFECGGCGCLQLADIPQDLSRYYSGGYYSLQPAEFVEDHPAVAFFKKQRVRYYLNRRHWLGYIVSRIARNDEFRHWLPNLPLDFHSKILDVGCGNGQLLFGLYKSGFRNLTGIDPFIDGDRVYRSGLRIYKKQLSSVTEPFDFVMFNHSFEHMPEQQTVLKQVHRILEKDQFLLLRIPVASSYAWQHYREKWVQLDAPRHLYLHTQKSIEQLAAVSGFDLMQVTYDSTDFQFWGSEQYLRDIPLTASNSYQENPERSIFSKEQINDFRKRAAELNKLGLGDSACFYLRKIG